MAARVRVAPHPRLQLALEEHGTHGTRRVARRRQRRRQLRGRPRAAVNTHTYMCESQSMVASGQPSTIQLVGLNHARRCRRHWSRAHKSQWKQVEQCTVHSHHKQQLDMEEAMTGRA